MERLIIMSLTILVPQRIDKIRQPIRILLHFRNPRQKNP